MTLLVAFGMPGIMSSWGLAALHAIAREAFVDYCTFQIGTLPDLKSAWDNRTSENVIVTAQHPDAQLCAFLMRSKTPYILFSENALDSVLYLARHMERQDASIVQAISASIACLSQLKKHPFLVHFDREKIGATPIHLILAHICRQFGISLSTGGMVRCLKSLGFDPVQSRAQIDQIPTFEQSAAKINYCYSAPGTRHEDIPENLQGMARGALAPFDHKILNGEVSGIVWPQESFLLADKGGEPAEGEITLVGRARCLVYGPYFHLPSGEWTAKYSLGIEQNVYGQIFTIEVHSDGLLSKIRVRPSGTGSFAAEAAFRIDSPKTPIEIRLFTDTGSIEGSIAYWSVELTAIGLRNHDSDPPLDMVPEYNQDEAETAPEKVNHAE
ncbi:hypothetical protein [Phyllobacterium myrsinacearum]|uniref:Gfo/Idh/MocA-like oxidoreductase N-terminal domain-containing protein n=1 Tax=Phyllobacterium myrsinacearum TaxID=28101 RepID=A0A839EPF2_9HYPH|nr:hypothetical protein [Phyllobacterium myrsinacearum]MBA8879374.1 hypothetical protein [Phyllobacterium myrsinacearum]